MERTVKPEKTGKRIVGSKGGETGKERKRRSGALAWFLGMVSPHAYRSADKTRMAGEATKLSKKRGNMWQYSCHRSNNGKKRDNFKGLNGRDQIG